MNNRSPESLINEAIAKCRIGKYEEALVDFNMAAKSGLNEKLLYNRSKALFRLRRLEEAMSDLDTLIDLQPANPEWYAERAVIFHYNKNKKDALMDLDKAVDLDPENGFRYSSRAFIKDFYGDLEGAVRDYEMAIYLDPNDAISFNNKGLVEEKLGYTEKAKASFSKADKLVPQTLNSTLKDPHNLVNNPKRNIGKGVGPKPGNLTLKHFLNTTREVLSTKEGARSFLNFVFGKK